MANFASPPESRTADAPVARPRETVGDVLKRARLEQGGEIDQIGAALRIRASYLAAIEQARYDRLPGVVYALGFVRTYANHLGLDGDEAVRRFKIESAGLEQRQDLAFPMPLTARSIPGGKLVLVAVVLAVCAYGVWHYISTGERDRPERIAAVPTSLLPPPAPTPAAPPGKAAPGEAAPAPAASATEVAASAAATAATAPTPGPVIASPLPPPATATAANPTAAQPGASRVAPPPPQAAPTPSPTAGLTPPPAPQAGEAAKPTPTTVAAANSPAPPVPAPSAPTDVANGAPAADAAATPAPASGAQPASAEPLAAGGAAVPAAAPATPAPAPRVFGAIDGPSHITLLAVKECWIQVRDGDPAQTVIAQRTLHAGDSYRVPDKTGLTLRTGNASVLQVLVDDRAAPALGGTVREVALDPTKLLSGNAVE